LLYVYGLYDINIHNLSKRRLLYRMHGLAKKKNTITKVLLIKEYKYMVVGYHSGLITIWKISNNKKLIHNYESHTRPIESLFIHKDGRIFWSAGQDMTIKLWNLDTFTNIYSYSLNGTFHKMVLINNE
jgi:WD40 repeat protein